MGIIKAQNKIIGNKSKKSKNKIITMYDYNILFNTVQLT